MAAFLLVCLALAWFMVIHKFVAIWTGRYPRIEFHWRSGDVAAFVIYFALTCWASFLYFR